MKPAKFLGIWMDHSNAHLMDLTVDPMETKTITSKFTHEVKEESLNKNENLMHNKEQHQQSEYYKQLGDTIKDYNEVILFGPTTAKSELLNILRADHNFENIKIDVKQTDKMNEHEAHAFVRGHFLK